VNSNESFNQNVSVVIPTIGEPTLADVIIALNIGTLIPKEIIIAIPQEKVAAVRNFEGGNVKILALNLKGQVKQRIEGFKIAKYDYVLQLDSDIIVKRDTVQNLVLALDEQGLASAICPVYDNGYEDPLIRKQVKLAKVFKKMLNLLLDGRFIIPPGTITKAGIQEWPPFASDNNKYAKSEWLPGGCVMHSKQNLYLNDYYPFTGKAYGEDVIHSILLRNKGVSLYICRNAVIKNDGAYDEVFNTFGKLYKYLKKTYLYKSLIVKLINGSFIRLFLWMLFFSASQSVRYLKTNRKYLFLKF
jgi:GT2 family glycosyltransferase